MTFTLSAVERRGHRPFPPLHDGLRTAVFLDLACIVCGKSLAFHSPPVWCSRPTSNSCPPMPPVQFVAHISQA